MKQLFTYAVLLDSYDTDEKGNKKFKDTKIVLEPKTTLANNEKEVVFKVTREIPAEFASDPDNVRILVKNF